MNKEEKSALIAVLITILVGILVGWAGSQGSLAVGSVPLFGLIVALAYLIQWLAFIPAFLLKTEKFFDLTGSITYISLTILAVVLSGRYDPRSLLTSALVIVWAGRLGAFLFQRVLKAGEDKRFREMKQSLWLFLRTWTLQGLWVTFTLAAALAIFSARESVPLGAFAIIGFVIWAIGFGIEAAADWQKQVFRKDPANKGKFIRSGLWAWSRHPNYFGEIVLWIGVAVIALPVLEGWRWVALISPVFVTLLLTRISGVPLLEKRADAKWGGQADYEAYKATTPVLVPRPPKAEK